MARWTSHSAWTRRLSVGVARPEAETVNDFVTIVTIYFGFPSRVVAA